MFATCRSSVHEPTSSSVLDSCQMQEEYTEGSVVILEDGRLLRRSGRSLVKALFPPIDCRASSEPPKKTKPFEPRPFKRARSSVMRAKRRDPVAEEKRRSRRLQRRGARRGAATISPPYRPFIAYLSSPTHTYGTRSAAKHKETRGSAPRSVFRALRIVQWDRNDKRRQKQLRSTRCIKQEEENIVDTVDTVEHATDPKDIVDAVEHTTDANEPDSLVKNTDPTTTAAIKAVLFDHDAAIKSLMEAPPEICKNPVSSPEREDPSRTPLPTVPEIRKTPVSSPIRCLPPVSNRLESPAPSVSPLVNAVPAAARSTSPSAIIEEQGVIPRVVRRPVHINPASQNARISWTVSQNSHLRSTARTPSTTPTMVTRLIQPRSPAMTSGGVGVPRTSGTQAFRQIGSTIAATSRLGPRSQGRTVVAPMPNAPRGGHVAASPQTMRQMVTQPLRRTAPIGSDHRAQVQMTASGPAGPPYPFIPATATPGMAGFCHLPTSAASSSSYQPSARMRPADAGPGSASEVRTSLPPTTTRLEPPSPPVLGDENMDPADFEMLSQLFMRIPDETFKALTRVRERRTNQGMQDGTFSNTGYGAGAQVDEDNLEPQPGCSHWSQ